MTRANKALVMMVVISLGLWGCAQEHNHPSAATRIRNLESKNAKLEDDYRAAIAARDQIRKKFLALEKERSRLSEQLEQIDTLAKERDELRQQVKARTNERDTLQSQFELLRKGIKNLLGQMETTSATNGGQPVTEANKTNGDGKS